MQTTPIVPFMEESMTKIVKTQAELQPDDAFLNACDHGDTAQVCGAVLFSKINDPTDSRSHSPIRTRALSDQVYKPSTDQGISASERVICDRSPSHKISESPTTTLKASGRFK